jgi:mannosyltransferase
VLAAVARFTLLMHQSLWFDEIVSATLAKQHFGAMLHSITLTESTPPLYYIVLWVWARIFGHSAAVLRSLSACIGVLTVLVIYAAARVRFTRRAAVVAAVVAALHPMLIWYSQETRAYELVTLFVACTLYFILRARSDASGRVLTGWAISAAAALATHYFAVFVVVPEAVVLFYLVRHRTRRVAAAVAVPVVVGAALLPLAIGQRNTGHTSFIGKLPFRDRLHHTVNQLVLGNYETSGKNLAAFCLLLMIAVAVAIALRATVAERRDAILLAGVAAAGLVLPAVLANSAFFYRNLIVVVPPLVLLLGVAAGLRHAPAWTTVAGLLVAIGLVVPTVEIARNRGLQRFDWRDAARLIGRSGFERAIITYPGFEAVTLHHYRPGLRVVTAGTLHLREIVVVGRKGLTTLRLPGGFRRVAYVQVGTLRLERLRAKKPRVVHISSLHLRPPVRVLSPKGFLERDEKQLVGQDGSLLVGS